MKMYLNRIGFSLLIILLTGCQSRTVNKSTESSLASPDPTLFREWSSETQSREQFEPPYVSSFNRNGYTLDFIASDHSTGLDSATFRTIRDTFKKVHAKIVIIEGFPFNAGVSPKFITDMSLKCLKDKFSVCMEPLYASYLARQDEVPFIGAEPNEEFILQGITKQGYSAEDLLGYYIVRMIPQWQQEGKFQKNKIKKLIEKEILDTKKQIPVSKDYNEADFEAWFRKATGQKFSTNTIRNSTIAPATDNKATTINKLAALTGRLRDEHIIKVIHQSLRDYKNVLIVYGAGHLVMQRPAIEKMMGTSRDSKLY